MTWDIRHVSQQENTLDFDLSEVKRMFEMLGVKQLAFV